MAGILCSATTAEIALTAATAKTVIQIVAPTNQRLIVKSFGVFFDGVSTTAEPVQVRVLRQTTAGTMSSLTPAMISAGSETLQATAQHTATAEPTAGNVLDVYEVHPQAGLEKMIPLDQKWEVPGGTRLGIECTAPSGVNVRAKIIYEE